MHATAVPLDAVRNTGLYSVQVTTSDCRAEGAQTAVETVVEVVDSPSSDDAFPGLYLGALPENPFLGMMWFPS